MRQGCRAIDSIALHVRIKTMPNGLSMPTLLLIFAAVLILFGVTRLRPR